MTCPERDLGVAILHRALLDAVGSGKSGHEPAWRVEQRVARAWFERGGEDFRTICTMAGLDPVAVREGYREAMKDPTATRAVLKNDATARSAGRERQAACGADGGNFPKEMRANG